MVDLERLFPGLKGTGYSITSEAERQYNCIAWAAGDDSRWWEPDAEDQYYWPEEALREYTVRAYAEAFLSIGFEICHEVTWEEGLEKVAIFADANDMPTHAARQLVGGAWTSKLGQAEDIRHMELEHVSGVYYGDPVLILQRRRTDS